MGVTDVQPLGGSTIWAAAAGGCFAGCASGRSNLLRMTGGARVQPLQRAAAAGRGRGVRSLDQVDVLLAASQTESPKPPWLTA